MAKESRAERLHSCLGGPLFLLYVNYFSLTWGNRMWNFALGLFFVVLGETELLLAAIYGFLMGGSVLIFGGLIGNWVDRSNRLIAIRKSILIQKICVALCASLICVILWFNSSINQIWHGILSYILHGIVIFLAILAELATMAYMRIQLQKDWFVVITNGKQSKLANLNAGTRSVDLITNIVTPIVTGQIMTSTSQVIAGATIVVWHVAAIVLETFILTKIYRMVPQMTVKQKGEELTSKKESLLSESENQHIINTQEKVCHDSIPSEALLKNKDQLKEEEATRDAPVKDREDNKCCSTLVVMAAGWKVYTRQLVVLAGVALALLYMTVLGFDGVTVGYIYANGIPENIVGVITAIASLMGVLGAFLYTQIRKCIGLERTGLISYTWQIICLILCVLSIGLPGTCFKPEALWKDSEVHNVTNCNESASTIDVSYNINTTSLSTPRFSLLNDSSHHLDYNYNNYTSSGDCTKDPGSFVTQSIVVFLVGVACSRIGLYLTDLVVAQLQQENVAEHERGIVNGVQNSLNHFMDMLKFTLVIFLPRIETFGYLIMLSFISVFMAGACYTLYCFKVSQYSLKNCLTGNTLTKHQKSCDSVNV